MALTASQLIEARRLAVLAAFPAGAPVTVDKSQIDAVSAAVSTWLDNNAASFVTAVAPTVLAGATTAVKAQVLAAVAVVKYGSTQ